MLGWLLLFTTDNGPIEGLQDQSGVGESLSFGLNRSIAVRGNHGAWVYEYNVMRSVFHHSFIRQGRVGSVQASSEAQDRVRLRIFRQTQYGLAAFF